MGLGLKNLFLQIMEKRKKKDERSVPFSGAHKRSLIDEGFYRFSKEDEVKLLASQRSFVLFLLYFFYFFTFYFFILFFYFLPSTFLSFHLFTFYLFTPSLPFYFYYYYYFFKWKCTSGINRVGWPSI